MHAYLRLLKYLRPHMPVIAITWAMSLLVLGCQVLTLWVGAGFIQKVLLSKELVGHTTTSSVVLGTLNDIVDRLLSAATPFASLVTAVVVILLTQTLTIALRVGKMYMLAKVSQNIVVHVRSEAFAHLIRLDLAFSRKRPPGEVASLFLRDTEYLDQALVNTADRMFMQPIRLAIALTLMFLLSPVLASWTLVLVVVNGAFVHFIGAKIERLNDRSLDRTAQLQGRFTEYLTTVPVSRAFGREASEEKDFIARCSELKTLTVRFIIMDALAPQFVSAIFILVGGAVLLVGGHQVLVTGTLPGETLLKMLAVLPMLTYPMEALASLYADLRSSIAAAKRVFGFLGLRALEVDREDAVEPPSFSSELALEGVGLEIGTTTILSDASLRVGSGSTVVLYGPSGSGKTTILNLLAGFSRPTSGRVLVDGVDLDRCRMHSWREQLGIVFQEPVLLNDTIRGNMRYAVPDADDDLIRKTLRDALLESENTIFREGLDTQVGNRGEFLSGGERQRLTVARALLRDPKILLLDEPTSMLDDESRLEIRKTIQAVARNRTVVIATHDADLREMADVTLAVENGRVRIVPR
jgi:ATP-binding cassette, subfamily B, bacterial MsbA